MCLTCKADRFKPHAGVLVGRTEMHMAPFAKTGRYVFKHQAERDRHFAQEGNVSGGHHPRIGMWQKPGIIENRATHLREIRNRRFVSKVFEFLAGLAVAQFRLVAERKQRLCTTGFRAGTSNRENFVTREKAAFAPSRRLGKGAVGAEVPAKMRQWNEDLP